MSFVAAASITAGTAILGGILGGNASKSAARMQAAAADRATQLQREMYNQNRADQEPWRKAGLQAMGGMQDQDFQRDFTMSDFVKDPGYDFRMQEGQKALERSASARGGLQGGGFAKALSRFGQDFASNEYGTAYNRFNGDRDRRFGRLSNLASIGQGANNANQVSGQNFANVSGQNMMGAANVQGAAGIAGANAWGNSLSGVARAGMDYSAMNQQNKWMDLQRQSLSSPGAPAIVK